MKSTSRLDGGTCKRKTGPLLLREELYPQGRRTAKRHSQNVPRPPDSRTPRGIRDIQFHSTTLLVARAEDLHEKLRSRVRGMSTVQDRPTTDETFLSSNGRSFHHQTLCELLHGLYHRPPPGKRTQFYPRNSRSRINEGDNSYPMFKSNHRRRNCATIIGTSVQTFWTTG